MCTDSDALRALSSRLNCNAPRHDDGHDQHALTYTMTSRPQQAIPDEHRAVAQQGRARAHFVAPRVGRFGGGHIERRSHCASRHCGLGLPSPFRAIPHTSMHLKHRRYTTTVLPIYRQSRSLGKRRKTEGESTSATSLVRFSTLGRCAIILQADPGARV